MDVQLLNGIDIQYLNGVNAFDHALGKRAKQMAEAKRRAVAHITQGITNDVARKAAWVASGNDFAGFMGDGRASDDECIRRYLKNTMEVAEEAPSMVASYQQPKALAGAIGYVLKMWDTPYREEAVDNMIAEEQRQMSMGGIDVNVADDAYDRTAEDYYDVDAYVHGIYGTKRSFWKSVKKTMKPSLTTEAQDIVASNPAIQKRLAEKRELVKGLRDSNVNIDNAQVNGINDDVDVLIQGTDLEYAVNGENPMDCFKAYLIRTRRVAVENPSAFESYKQAEQTAMCIDTVLKVWDNPSLRQHVMDQIENIQGLDGFLKKVASKVKTAAKKVATATKTAAKATAKVTKKAAQAVAKATKKVGKGIAKVAKKVWKLIVRFNPLTLLIRAGILGFCRLNMFKIANKTYIGSLTKEEAMKLGASESDWKKSNEAYGHLKNAYTKLGGYESKLKKVLAKGNKKKWTGTEYPTDGAAIKAAAQKVSAADDKLAQQDMDYDETMKEYTSKGYVADSNVSADVTTVESKQEVTVIDNERTAKSATKLYEGDDKAKVLVTIPKAGKVYVDLKQTSGDLIAASYGNSNGWVDKNTLAGLGECDAESVAVIGIDNIIEVSGLGEPATLTAVAAASGTIATIMGKVKNIFGKAKDVVSSVKSSVSKAKETVSKVKKTVNTAKNVATNTASAIKSVKSGDITSAISTMKNVTATQEPASETTTDQTTTTTTTTTEIPAQVVSDQTGASTASATSSKTKKWLLIGGGVALVAIASFFAFRKR